MDNIIDKMFGGDYYRGLVAGSGIRNDIFRFEVGATPNGYVDNGFMVDTCKLPDSYKWETAVENEKYGCCVPVELYETREEATKGHEKWVKLMQEDPLRDLERVGDD